MMTRGQRERRDRLRRNGLRGVVGASEDSRREQLARVREQIEAETVIVEGAKSKFWAAIRQKVYPEGMIARAKLDGHDKMGNEERAIWLDRFLRYEWFLGLVERAPRTLDILEQKFAKLKADLENQVKGDYNV